jgi:hypothetical protein
MNGCAQDGVNAWLRLFEQKNLRRLEGRRGHQAYFKPKGEKGQKHA